MRLIGLVLALGAIVWVMMQLAGGSDAETMVPESPQQALEKAEGLEENLQQDLDKKMQDLQEGIYE